MRYPTDPVIRVDFVEASTGEVFAYTDMPSSQLPDVFDSNSTMDIGGQAWIVVRAMPNSSAEFRRTGKLRLDMSRPTAATVDPNAVIYSMPTIEDAIPGIDPDSNIVGKHVLKITEDDWRQIEFVGFRWEFRIEPEFEPIKAVKREHAANGGYTSLHMRGSIPEPLAGTPMTVEELIHVFGPGTRIYDGIAYQGTQGMIYGGFAILTPAMLHVYGTHDTNGISALCLYNVMPAPEDEALAAVVWREVQALSDFMRRKKICLVSWCDCARLLPGTPDLFVFFGL